MPSLKHAPPCRWREFATPADLEQAAMQAILQAAQQSVTERGAFHIVLAGGATPRHVYELLSKAEVDWGAWHVYFGDERCLPAGHADRNSRMAALAWLDQVTIPRGQIHYIPAEAGAEAAASAYSQTCEEIELFDLVLLGLGEDGHTASLFPGHEWGATSGAPAVLAVHGAPKPPLNRVSLSAKRLSATRHAIFLVTGTTKRQAINDWRNGAKIPPQAITPANGVDIYLEAGLLEN